MRTGGELLVACLEAQGVTTSFGVPGESYLAVLDALHDSSIDYVTCRQEGGVGYAAAAWGKLTNQPGIGFVTRGRGVSVHRADCLNASELSEGQPDRLIEVEWDRMGLLQVR